MEREPTSEAELFRLALSRLDDLKLELEDGDESDASLVRKVADEPELRRVIAGRLRQAAHSKYDTGSEEELADKSRTDIRLHNQRAGQPVPIELKIAGKWSGSELRERLENQLTQQYLRAARHGVFLVVNRGADGDNKQWVVDGNRVDFAGVVSWLAAEAKTLVVRSTTIQGLEVIGIDLLKRDSSISKKTKPMRQSTAAPGKKTV